MISDMEERMVRAIELIAVALSGIYETKQKEFARRFSEPKAFREAVVTHVLNEEERIREKQGASYLSLHEWLSDLGEEEIAGIREREYLERHAGAQAPNRDQTDSRSAETPQS